MPNNIHAPHDNHTPNAHNEDGGSSDSALPAYEELNPHALHDDTSNSDQSTQPSAPQESCLTRSRTLPAPPPPPINPALLPVISRHSYDSPSSSYAASESPLPTPASTPGSTPLLSALLPPPPPSSQPAQTPPPGVSLVPLQANGKKEKRFVFVPASTVAAILRSREVLLNSPPGSKYVKLFVPECFTVTQLVDRWLPNFVLLPLAQRQGSLLVNPCAVTEITPTKVSGTRITSLTIAARRRDDGDRAYIFEINLGVAVVVRMLDPEGFPKMAMHLEDQDLGYGDQILSGYSA
ncbi:hypothetical protein HDU87_006381 [Geranomyces variabilis]|uniref:Uncharacterized protein n=1 Tax=Geranomyces variabilis TaxID=109894 RepID=A0AAD5XKE3_9FUNG|nr:hypothetical protein HDU87_006381 [Geranomyces variabilis]